MNQNVCIPYELLGIELDKTSFRAKGYTWIRDFQENPFMLNVDFHFIRPNDGLFLIKSISIEMMNPWNNQSTSLNSCWAIFEVKKENPFPWTPYLLSPHHSGWVIFFGSLTPQRERTSKHNKMNKDSHFRRAFSLFSS